MTPDLSNRLLPRQIRGARGLLDWSMSDLATAARVSISTVKRVERDGQSPVSDDVRHAIRSALEAAGVSFFADDGGGIGLLFRHRSQPPSSSPLPSRSEAPLPTGPLDAFATPLRR